MHRFRNQILYGLAAVTLFLLGGALTYALYFGANEDSGSRWETSDSMLLGVAVVLGIGGVLCGVMGIWSARGAGVPRGARVLGALLALVACVPLATVFFRSAFSGPSTQGSALLLGLLAVAGAILSVGVACRTLARPPSKQR